MLNITILLTAVTLCTGGSLLNYVRNGLQVSDDTHTRESFTETKLKQMLLNLAKNNEVKTAIDEKRDTYKGMLPCYYQTTSDGDVTPALTFYLTLAEIAHRVNPAAHAYGIYIQEQYREKVNRDCFQQLKTSTREITWGETFVYLRIMIEAFQIKAMFIPDDELKAMIHDLSMNDEVKKWSLKEGKTDEDVEELCELARNCNSNVEKYPKAMLDIADILCYYKIGIHRIFDKYFENLNEYYKNTGGLEQRIWEAIHHKTIITLEKITNDELNAFKKRMKKDQAIYDANHFPFSISQF